MNIAPETADRGPERTQQRQAATGRDDDTMRAVIALCLLTAVVFVVAVDYARMLANAPTFANLLRVVAIAGVFGCLWSFWSRYRHGGS